MMLINNIGVVRLTGMLLTTLAALSAQSLNPALTVPRTVRYTGSFRPADRLPTQPVEGVTVAVYRDQTGGDPLWQETQNVQVDTSGNFTVEMGATQNGGLPLDLLRTGEPRWMGVRVNRPGESEQPRVQMLSVPYALRASDAETLGGLPASAYLVNPSAAAPGSAVVTSGPARANTVKPHVTSGTSNYIGVFTSPTDLGNSVLYQIAGKIGLNTVNPLDYFHVAFNDATGNSTGYSVQNLGGGPASYSGMLFYDQNRALVNFQGFNNFTHEYRINNIASNGSINFMLGSQSKFQVRSDGDIDIAGSIRKGGTLFLHNLGFQNTAFGLGALSSNTTGYYNAASGYGALQNNTTGLNNTASGGGALQNNTTGLNNTASGSLTLFNNTIGSANTSSGNGALFSNINGANNTANGVIALYGNTSGSNNTAVGVEALFSNTTASGNTGIGSNSLQNNTAGDGNTACGSGALFNNTVGDDNTACGANALYTNTTGGQNTAIGLQALASNTIGSNNTVSGAGTLFNNTSGSNNTVSGFNALSFNTTGNNNTAMGYYSGFNLTTGNNNIMVGNQGASSDDHKIRIGDVQTSTFIAGIRGITTGASNAVTVVIDSNGQLGTINSSHRFKQDIQDMGDASSRLMRLRPVTYRYKQSYADGSKPLDYGLIAEEVAEVYPDLVVKSKDGQVETVQYQKLTPMLLNEVQKQRRHAQQQDETIQQLQQQNQKLEARLATLESAKVPATNTFEQ